MRHDAPARAGLTLVEVLVAIVAVSVVLAWAVAQPVLVDLPVARVLNCRNRIAAMAEAMATYAADHKNFFAGPNTSGADGQFDGGLGYLGSRTGQTPVSTHDWMSPTIGRVSTLPVNRAARTQALLNEFACPDAAVFNTTLFGNAPDLGDFQQRFGAGGFRQVSYLSPSAFHYFGSSAAAAANRYRGIVLKSSQTSPVRVPDTYRPRLDLLGVQPAQKAYAADGTRFLDATGVLDIDISPNPSINGNALDAGPIVHASAAYGRAFASAPNNLPLSFRHRGATINVAFFDGHVGALTRPQAWTDATRWYPGGSIYGGVGATPESAAFHAPASVLP